MSRVETMGEAAASCSFGRWAYNCTSVGKTMMWLEKKKKLLVSYFHQHHTSLEGVAMSVLWPQSLHLFKYRCVFLNSVIVPNPAWLRQGLFPKANSSVGMVTSLQKTSSILTLNYTKSLPSSAMQTQQRRKESLLNCLEL